MYAIEHSNFGDLPLSYPNPLPAHVNFRGRELRLRSIRKHAFEQWYSGMTALLLPAFWAKERAGSDALATSDSDSPTALKFTSNFAF